MPPEPRRFLLAWPSLFALVFGSCLGLVRANAWVNRLAFQRLSWEGWPRPRGTDWLAASSAQWQWLSASARWIESLAWLSGIALFLLIARAQSADLPFLITAPETPGRRRNWLKVWVDPRLSARGIIGGFATTWLLGLPLLGASPEVANTPVRRLLFGGPLTLLEQAAWLPPLLRHLLTSVLLMTLLLLIWSSDGWFTRRRLRLPALARTAGRGAMAGLAVAVVWLPFTGIGFNLARVYLRANGPLAASATMQLMLWTVILSVAGSLALTAILWRKPAVSTIRSQRIAWLTIAVLAGAQWNFQRTLVNRFDYGRTLAVATKLAPARLSDRRMAILVSNRPRCPSASVRFRTGPGLDATEAGERKVELFLRSRRYRTGLGLEAFVQLFDSAALQLDRPAQLRRCLDNLRAYPSVQPVQRGQWYPQAAVLLNDLLPDLQSDPKNRELLAELCDPQRFDLSRAPRMNALIGDAWWRLGDEQRARDAWQRAGARRRYVERRTTELMVRDGKVWGALQVKGKPAGGVKVGLVSTRHWLELNGTTAAPPNAFALRRICAATRTDSAGRFALRGLVTGQYYLVMLFPPEVVPPGDEVEVTNQPGVITIRPDRERNVGLIQVKPVPAIHDSGRQQSI